MSTQALVVPYLVTIANILGSRLRRLGKRGLAWLAARG